jgi:chorismate mutase
MSGLAPVYAPGSELLRRRHELAERVAELQWNLGGLTYEMAIRDHFRLDVLVRRAAMLQECEIELAEIDRVLEQ